MPHSKSSSVGLDVSSYQRKIDWKKVTGSKVFVFIKATEGAGLVDKTFATNWPGAHAAGLLRGAYHFFHPSIDAIEQADLSLSKVVACELPPVLDVEAMDNVASAKLIQGVNRWVEHVTTNLRRPRLSQTWKTDGCCGRIQVGRTSRHRKTELLENGRHPMFKSPDGHGRDRMLKLSP